MWAAGKRKGFGEEKRENENEGKKIILQKTVTINTIKQHKNYINCQDLSIHNMYTHKINSNHLSSIKLQLNTKMQATPSLYVSKIRGTKKARVDINMCT